MLPQSVQFESCPLRYPKRTVRLDDAITKGANSAIKAVRRRGARRSDLAKRVARLTGAVVESIQPFLDAATTPFDIRIRARIEDGTMTFSFTPYICRQGRWKKLGREPWKREQTVFEIEELQVIRWAASSPPGEMSELREEVESALTSFIQSIAARPFKVRTRRAQRVGGDRA